MALLDLVSRTGGIVAFTVGIERMLHGHLVVAAALMLVGLFLANLTAMMERILRRPGGPWDGEGESCSRGTCPPGEGA